MVLVIDNYDSFTYNLVQYLQELGAATVTYRNDKVTIEQMRRMEIERVIISPGPGRPPEAGISAAAIEAFYKKVPILGVCLGHQCIGAVFGAKIVKAPQIMHGKTSLIYHHGSDIFQDISNPFTATRYHSLIVDRATLPQNLSVIAHTQDGIIMGIKEVNYPLFGVQFHPESILTHEGKGILANFLKI